MQSTKHKGSEKLHPKAYFHSIVLIYSLLYFATIFVEHNLQLPTALLLQRFLNTIKSKPSTKKGEKNYADLFPSFLSMFSHNFDE